MPFLPETFASTSQPTAPDWRLLCTLIPVSTLCVFSRIILWAMLLAATALQARAQESLPAAAEPAVEPAAQPQPTGRIVEGRPPLYNVKRTLHPLTWLEA